MNILKSVVLITSVTTAVSSCGKSDSKKDAPANQQKPAVEITDAQVAGDLVTVKFRSDATDATFKCKVDIADKPGTWELCGPESYLFLLSGQQSYLFSIKSVNGDKESSIISRHFTTDVEPQDNPVPGDTSDEPGRVPSDGSTGPQPQPLPDPGPGPQVPQSGPEGDFAGAIYIDRNGICEIRYGNDTEFVDCKSYFDRQQCSTAIRLSFPKLQLLNPPICIFQGTGCYSLNYGVRAQLTTMSPTDVDVVFSGLPDVRSQCNDLGQVAVFQCKISQ